MLDLAVQQIQRLLEILHSFQKLGSLLNQDILTGIYRLRPLFKQGNIFDKRLYLYPGLPHALHQLNPFQGILIIIPDSAFRTGHRREQTDALIIAQRIR